MKTVFKVVISTIEAKDLKKEKKEKLNQNKRNKQKKNIREDDQIYKQSLSMRNALLSSDDKICTSVSVHQDKKCA